MFQHPTGIPLPALSELSLQRAAVGVGPFTVPAQLTIYPHALLHCATGVLDHRQRVARRFLHGLSIRRLDDGRGSHSHSLA
jgi:hypothetical protein